MSGQGKLDIGPVIYDERTSEDCQKIGGLMKILIGSVVLAVLASLFWVLSIPKNFEDCILKNIKGSESTPAVAAINDACMKKFPEAEKKLEDKNAHLVDFSSKLEAESSFFGLTLGDNFDAVIYKLGPPESKPRENLWEYENPKLTIAFEEKKVAAIIYICDPSDQFKPLINGVMCGASEFDLQNRYGNKSVIYCDEDKERRTFTVNKFNLWFGLHRGVVETLGVTTKTPKSNKC